MSRSFSSAKLVADRVCAAVSRGYASAAPSQAAVSGGRRAAREVSRNETAWVPDPVTGVYRPENVAKEADAAELREILLKGKVGRN